MFYNLKQHHSGYLVESIDDFKKHNKKMWDESDYSEVFSIKAQNVKVCFINKTGGAAIELVEPGSSNKALTRMLSNGVSIYHLAFTSPCYDATVQDFKMAHCHQVTEFFSEAFMGKRCSFFYHPQLKLIELIESNP